MGIGGRKSSYIPITLPDKSGPFLIAHMVRLITETTKEPTILTQFVDFHFGNSIEYILSVINIKIGTLLGQL